MVSSGADRASHRASQVASGLASERVPRLASALACRLAFQAPSARRSGRKARGTLAVSAALGAFAFIVTGIASPHPARAEPATNGLENVDIRYLVREGVVGCPTADEFRAGVRRRLSTSIVRPGAPVVVTTEISAQGGGIQARVAMLSNDSSDVPGGIQELYGGASECATLSAAAALTVALAIEQSREEGTNDAPSAPPASDERRAAGGHGRLLHTATSRSDRSESPPSKRAPASDGAPRGGLRWQTHAAILAGYEVAPRWAAGTAFGAALRSHRWSIEAEAVVWPWTTVTDEHATDLAGRARLVFARGALCAHLNVFFGCATGSVGDYAVTGSGRVVSQSDHVVWSAVGARAGVEWFLLPDVAVVLRGDLQVPLLHPSLELDGRSLWRAPTVGVDVGLGARLTLW